MANASEQFRAHVGLEGDPDSKLGLENAKGKGGGKPIDTGDVRHHSEVSPAATTAEASKVSTETGDKAEDTKSRRSSGRSKK